MITTLMGQFDHITAFSVSGILIAVTSFLFGTFVLWKSPTPRIGRLWFLFCLSAGLWGLGIAFIGQNQNPELGLRLWRWTYGLGVLWISPLFYHFTSAFLEQENKKTIRVHYIIALIFLALIPTPYFFVRCELVFEKFCYIRGGFIYHLFILWWMGVVVAAHIQLWKSIKLASSARKNQIKYFLLATAMGYTGGFFTYFPKIGIDIYPWGGFAVPVYPIIMTYAIMKYNLMDIRIFIRRAVLLVSIYGALLVVTVPVILFVHNKAVAHGTLSQPYLLAEILLSGLVLSAGPFLYAVLVRHNEYFHENTVAGLAHELKSPLANIESALDMLSGLKHTHHGNPKEAEYMDMIERNTARLQNAVEDLLLSFPFQNSRAPLHITTTDLRALVLECAREYEPRAKAKNLLFQVYASDNPVLISCDAKKIRQVMSNLLSNAVKFTAQGSIRVTLETRPTEVLVSVLDTGPGILVHDLPFVFERFYQGQSGHSAKGTGVGLTIAKAWVEAHGGKIWAESEGEGKGTTMRFTLPI